MDSEELLTIATFAAAPEAHLARGLLREAGIEAFLLDESVVQATWLFSQAVGGIKLQVPASRRNEALRVLRESHSAAASQEPPPATRCPRCGSIRVGRRAGNVELSLLAWALVGYPIPLGGRRWVCQDCGREWKSRWEGAPDDQEELAASGPPAPAEIDSAIVPWRFRRVAVGVGLIGGALVPLLSLRLDAGSALGGLGVFAGLFALLALFTLRWQRISITSLELRVEDADGLFNHAIRDLEARKYANGLRVVELRGTPFLVAASSHSLLPQAIPLGEADMDRIWERIRWLRRGPA